MIPNITKDNASVEVLTFWFKKKCWIVFEKSKNLIDLILSLNILYETEILNLYKQMYENISLWINEQKILNEDGLWYNLSINQIWVKNELWLPKVKKINKLAQKFKFLEKINLIIDLDKIFQETKWIMWENFISRLHKTLSSDNSGINTIDDIRNEIASAIFFCIISRFKFEVEKRISEVLNINKNWKKSLILTKIHRVYLYFSNIYLDQFKQFSDYIKKKYIK